MILYHITNGILQQHKHTWCWILNFWWAIYEMVDWILKIKSLCDTPIYSVRFVTMNVYYTLGEMMVCLKFWVRFFYSDFCVAMTLFRYSYITHPFRSYWKSCKIKKKNVKYDIIFIVPSRAKLILVICL